MCLLVYVCALDLEEGSHDDHSVFQYFDRTNRKVLSCVWVFLWLFPTPVQRVMQPAIVILEEIP